LYIQLLNQNGHKFGGYEFSVTPGVPRPRISPITPWFHRVDAKNAFDGYIHSMRSATEGSGDNKGLSEKMDSDEKEPWIKTYCTIFFCLSPGGHEHLFSSYFHQARKVLDTF